MQKKATTAIPILDYAKPRQHFRPRHLWLPVVFFTVVAVGELFAIGRLSRWPWPMPEDYLLAGVLLAGAVTTSLLSRSPGWLIGLYGLFGVCLFYPGHTYTRAFRLGIAEPSAVQRHVLGWVLVLFAGWAICRATVLLRRRRCSAQ